MTEKLKYNENVFPFKDFVMEEFYRNAKRKIDAEKERLIFQKLEQLHLVDINFTVQAEAKRRFPRLKRELEENGTENWYWNDETEEGIHLIQFIPDNNFDMKDGKITIGFKHT